MSNVDNFFSEILQFSIIALILLLTTLVSIRFLNQPLERLRLVQISLLALFATLVLGLMGVVPVIDIALLPVDNTSTATWNATSVVATGEPRSSPRADGGELTRPSLDTTVLDFGAEAVSVTAEPRRVPSATPEANSNFVSPISDFALIVSFKKVFVYGFLIISLLNAAYLAVGLVASYRLIVRSTSLSGAAAHRVARIVDQFANQRSRYFVRCARIDVPMVSGIWRPTVLLPESLTRHDADEMALKHCLAHEWAHIARRDLLTWQLTNLCQVFLWIQPCYWILRRELRIAQDQLADQFATRHTGEHATYAETLLDLSRARQVILPGALAMAEGKSNLYRRIEMLLNDRFLMVRAARKTVVLPFAVLMLLAGVFLTSLQLSHAAPAPTPTNQGNDDVSRGDGEGADEESPTEAKSAEHSGVVIDADTNMPISGVTVTVTRMNSKDWRELAVTESTTDENGRYTFTIPPDQLSQRLLYIMFDIDHPQYARRHCGSYGYAMIAKNLENGEPPWFSKLEMVRGEKIFGRLVDENQRPVARAQLRFRCSPKSGFDRTRSTYVDGVSGEDGRFEAVVTHDGMAKLSIIPPDHCMKHTEIGEKRGDLGDITLDRGFPIQGVVQDAKGNPMPDLWVNITPEEQRREASYEMKRSSKTDKQGIFRTRPLKPGKYLVQVELKATGALEKKKYANFHDTPPPAMFVEQTISVTEDSIRKPVIIRAVPHVLITLQFFKPNGEISSGHSPHMFGEIDGRRIWIREGKRTGEGAYQLMAPHGFENVDLRFTTNKHSALMVQFEGGELSPRDSYRFDRLEEDINNIRVVRYPAAIAKIKVVDDAGAHLKDARIFTSYAVEENDSEEMMMGNQIGWNREDGLFRLSSIVPDREFSVRASLSGYQTKTQFITMKEEERRTVAITLKKGEVEAQPADE